MSYLLFRIQTTKVSTLPQTPDLLQVFRMLFYNELNSLILLKKCSMYVMMFGFRLVFQRSLKSLTFVFLTFLHFVIFSQYYTAVLEMFREKKRLTVVFLAMVRSPVGF